MGNCFPNEICQSQECFCPPQISGERCDIFGPLSINSFSTNNGTRNGGTPIRLEGENISPTSDACNFGGILYDFAEWISFNEVICITPAGTGTTQVSIRRRDGSSESNRFTFTYYGE